jgi:hypothetical protein
MSAAAATDCARSTSISAPAYTSLGFRPTTLLDDLNANLVGLIEVVAEYR